MLNFSNLFLNFPGTVNNTVRKPSDFVCNDSEGLSCFTRRRRFKLGVKSDDFCLVGNVIDEGYDIPDVFNFFTQVFNTFNSLLVCIKNFMKLLYVQLNLSNAVLYISRGRVCNA